MLCLPPSPSALSVWSSPSPGGSSDRHCSTGTQHSSLKVHSDGCVTSYGALGLHYLAAVGVMSDEGGQQLDGTLHYVYRLVHQPPHSQPHHLAVPTQRQRLAGRTQALFNSTARKISWLGGTNTKVTIQKSLPLRLKRRVGEKQRRVHE